MINCFVTKYFDPIVLYFCFADFLNFVVQNMYKERLAIFNENLILDIFVSRSFIYLRNCVKIWNAHVLLEWAEYSISPILINRFLTRLVSQSEWINLISFDLINIFIFFHSVVLFVSKNMKHLSLAVLHLFMDKFYSQQSLLTMIKRMGLRLHHIRKEKEKLMQKEEKQFQKFFENPKQINPKLHFIR